jgi:hypothetical protein
MPIRQGGILAGRASTWPRDHFCRSTMAPRASWPTTWNEFLPTSMADHGHRGIGCLRHGVLPVCGAPCQLRLLAGQEHGRTIPLTDIPPRSENDPYGHCDDRMHPAVARIAVVKSLNEPLWTGIHIWARKTTHWWRECFLSPVPGRWTARLNSAKTAQLAESKLDRIDLRHGED